MSASTQVFRTTLTASPLLITGRLLDNIPPLNDPIAVAFSVRRVYTSYKGPAFRVRRSSDGREQDIGFRQTDLDVEALQQFCNGFDGYVSVWYDQSTRNPPQNAVQTDWSLQPQIVEKGTVIKDTKQNQPTLRFNGAYLVTDWQPTAADVASGVGLLSVASSGLAVLDSTNTVTSVGSQPGTVSIFNTPGVTVTTDYPNPSLPLGDDIMLYEGLKLGNSKIVYPEAGKLQTVTIDPTLTPPTVVKANTDVPVPGGPPSLSVDVIDLTSFNLPVNQWKFGIKGANNKIYGIPYDAARVLEIDVLNKTAALIGTDFGSAIKGKWWSAVLSGNHIVCVPYNYNKVMRIDTTTATATTTLLAADYGTNQNLWRGGVLNPVNGMVYGVPFKSQSVLEINGASERTFQTATGVLNGGSYGKWQGGAYSNGKIYCVPHGAGTLLVINTSASPATASLSGSTGMFAQLGGYMDYHHHHKVVQGGRGYTGATVQVEISAPDDTLGIRATATATIEKTKIISQVTVANKGSGFTSTPVVEFLGDGNVNSGWVDDWRFWTSNPTFNWGRPSGQVVMESDGAGGYRVASVTVTSGGDGIRDTTPAVRFRGGKGTDARALAIVADGRVVGIIIPEGGGGSGYVSKPIVFIEGGGGSGATAQVDEISPIVYSGSGSALTSTGGSIASVVVINGGTGYSSANPPRIRFGELPNNIVPGSGGKGTTAVAQAVTVGDGKITGITINSGGSGYTVEPAAGFNASLSQIIIAAPSATPGGNPGVSGIDPRAVARIKAVGAGGAITEIEMVNTGMGYIATPAITFRTNSSASLSATFETDGRVGDVVLETSGTRYTRNPTVTISGRTPAVATTPGSAAVASAYLDGEINGAVYRYRYLPNSSGGDAKWIGAYATANGIFAMPYNTHRVLQINTNTDVPSDILGANNADFGLMPGKYSAIVGNQTDSILYGVPYNNKQVLKINASTGTSEFISKVFQGRWNSGVRSPANNNIYCFPAESNALLIIDTKNEERSEMVYFDNVRGNGDKWSWSVLSQEGVIYGIPFDVPKVIELNPGVALRSKSLPAQGIVLGDGKTIVYSPSSTERIVRKFNTDTNVMTTHTITATGNVSYGDAAVLGDGKTVIFIPTYNKTDAFAYSGNIGIFNSDTNVFSYGIAVPIDYATPYPSRSAVTFGPTVGGGNIVAWVPNAGTSAVVVYNHAAQTLTIPGTNEVLARRPETSVAWATAARSTPTQIVATLPTFTTVGLAPRHLTNSNYGISGEDDKISEGVLAPNGSIFCIPGWDRNVIQIFYPDNTTAEFPLETAPRTVIYTPEEMFRDTQYTKFGGGVLAPNNNIYCIPFRHPKVLSIDTASYTLEEFGDLGNTPGTQGAGVDMWRGGVIAPNGKIYCIPWSARKIMIIDPTINNPLERISYIETEVTGIAGNAAGDVGGKWWGGVLARNGKIYCVPFNAAHVLIIDPETDTVNFTSIAGLGSGGNKWSRGVLASNDKIYCVPFDKQEILVIDPKTNATSLVDSKQTGGGKWGGGAIGNNGLIYFSPVGNRSVLVVDPSDDTVETVGNFFVNNIFFDLNKWNGGLVAARNGRIYGMPSNFYDFLEIFPDRKYIGTYNYLDSRWTVGPSIQENYRFKPFAITETAAPEDPYPILFYGDGRYGIFDGKNASFGPSIATGVATFFENTNTFASVIGSNVTIVSPFKGGVAGVKSYLGQADLMTTIERSNLRITIGDGTTLTRNIFRTLFDKGSAGVFSGIAGDSLIETSVRDVKINQAPYAFSGTVGNTFSIGIIQGTKESQLNIPETKIGYSGLISEIVAVSSDQTSRRAALGESQSFYFLDSRNIFFPLG